MKESAYGRFMQFLKRIGRYCSISWSILIKFAMLFGITREGERESVCVSEFVSAYMNH
jgi:hypothetical protein